MFHMFTLPVGSTPTASNIKQAIEYNEHRKKRYEKLRKYYRGEHEILDRRKWLKKPSSSPLSNNKIVVNHARYITTIKTSYFIGIPVEYRTKDEAYQRTLEDVLARYEEINIHEHDYKLAKDNSKYGESYEYVYRDEELKPVSKKLLPINCVLVYDDTLEHRKLFAVIYEKVEYGDGVQDLNTSADDNKRYIGVQTIDAVEKRWWNEKLRAGKREVHLFGQVPVIEFLNNGDDDDESQGDYEMVMLLIDAYNTLQSDRINDKEQLVAAILLLHGFELTPDMLEMLREYRVMATPDKDDSAEYLTKMLNEADVEILRKSIEDDIHKISMTPNMGDENFIGNASGVALKYKILPFELSIQEKEMGFRRGLKERFELYNRALSQLTIEDDNAPREAVLMPTSKLEVMFKHSLPQNDLETSQMIANLDGKVSDETAIGLLSFVEDAATEKERVDAERKDAMNVELPTYGQGVSDLTGQLENTGRIAATEQQNSLLSQTCSGF
jgi:SPP1 family phage portal protein